MHKDLLLEIGTEEIPAKFMPGALAELANIAKVKLGEQRIIYSELKTVGTPRRLVLVIRDIEVQQADIKSENKGPAVKIAFDEKGIPTKAAQGFARGQGVDVNQLVVKEGYVFASVQELGRPVCELLPQVLTDVLHSLNFPKNMRWGNLDMRFVRPIRWLVALFGNEIVPFTLAEVRSANLSRGHRFLSKGDVIIESADDYFIKMAANHVMVDPQVRRQVIREQVEKLAIKQGGTANIDEDLLEEVVYLVEYPTALCGRFDDKYLALPPEAVITPMREHQRYFPVFSEEGKLLPVFITVRNGGLDYIDIVQHGNERVLRARLDDAQFFFEEDQKMVLKDCVEKLKTIVFQEGLGTLYDKTLRLEQLAASIARQVGVEESLLPLITRGAYLAKADLVTGMVCEFTELQGVMGREYARLQGETMVVAQAIFEHYLPRYAGDILPQGSVGRVISIADKLDNIVATFIRGLIPTGSQDPYALRRQALGIVNILIDGTYSVSLASLIDSTLELLGIHDLQRKSKISMDILEFFRLRVKNVLADKNVRYDIIDALMAVGIDDVYDTWLRAEAMSEQDGAIAMQRGVQAFARAGNLAKHATVTDIDSSLLSTDAERVLYENYMTAQNKINGMTLAKDYVGILKVMAEMAESIDAFFGEVMVMVEDIPVRNNRLALLKNITGLTAKLADLNKIVVG